MLLTSMNCPGAYPIHFGPSPPLDFHRLLQAPDPGFFSRTVLKEARCQIHQQCTPEGSFSMGFNGRSGTAKYTQVRSSLDKRWQFLHQHVNSDQETCEPKGANATGAVRQPEQRRRPVRGIECQSPAPNPSRFPSHYMQ